MLEFVFDVFSRLKDALGFQIDSAQKRLAEDDLDVSSDEESDSETTAKLLKRRRIETGHVMPNDSYKNSKHETYDWVKPCNEFDQLFNYKTQPTFSVPSKSSRIRKENDSSMSSTSRHVKTNHHNSYFSSNPSTQTAESTVATTRKVARSLQRKQKVTKSSVHSSMFALPSTSNNYSDSRIRKYLGNGIGQKSRRGVTAQESIRLEEKEKYRQLLLKYQSYQDYPCLNNSSVSPNMTISSRSTSSASQRQENGAVVLNHNPVPKRALLTEKMSAFDKYLYTKRILGTERRRLNFNASQDQSSSNHISPRGFFPSSRTVTSKVSPVEVVDLDSDDGSESSVVITKEDPPPNWKIYLTGSSRDSSSPSTSADWLKQWKIKTVSDKDQRKEEIDRATTILKSRKDGLEQIIKGLGKDIEQQLHVSLKTIEVLEEIQDEVEEEEKEELPEITPEMDDQIEAALHPHPPDEVLVEAFRLQIRRRDMETLQDLNWLNDEVINFYMNLLMERGKMDNMPSVYACNTFFYTKLLSGGHDVLKRWTRRVDIFGHDFMLVPVHLGVHWCLAVVHFTNKTLRYYDSMGGKNNDCLKALGSYLQAESMDKKKKSFDMTDWVVENAKGNPQQMNSSDCGMFACKYAEYLTRNSKITFKQEDMPHFRRQMVYEILNKRLL